MTRSMRRMAAAAGLAALLGAACGGGSSTSPSPTPSPVSGSPGPSGATITIGTNSAVSPSTVTINAGESVTFINNDSRSHEIASDPHPAHTDCPQMNALGVLSPGQTKNTNAFPTPRTCGFHDHGNPFNTALQGQVIIR